MKLNNFKDLNKETCQNCLNNQPKLKGSTFTTNSRAKELNRYIFLNTIEYEVARKSYRLMITIYKAFAFGEMEIIAGKNTSSHLFSSSFFQGSEFLFKKIHLNSVALCT